jgi:hypothetical protein
VPGLGASGPLLNISGMGLAMRVDRVIRLDTGMRLAIGGVHFPTNKYFSAVRVEELPGLPVVDLRAFAIHATEKGGILMLGLAFQEPGADVAKQLDDMLKLRVKLQAAKAPISLPDSTAAAPGARRAGESRTAAMVETPASWDAPEVLNEAPPEEEAEAASEHADPLRALQRRVLPLLVLGATPEASAPLAAWLRGKGYRRLAFAAKTNGQAPGTLVLDPQAEAPAPDRIPVPSAEAWDRELAPLLEQRAQERV